uniref:Seven TM Receptor n=3 Tax=Caenorhabditis japonica TaxID=281687 RepID=A0A8R1E556_CAEJA
MCLCSSICFFSENMLKNQNMSIDEITYMGPFFWSEGPDGRNYLHMRSFFGMVIMTAGILSSFFIIFYYGIKCYRSTKQLLDSASQSASFQALQSQLFYALVFQTLIPVILMHIPASVGFIISFLNISVELSGTICSVTICLYPALDPLPNFFIIKSYRNAICDLMRQIKMKIMCQKDNRVGILASGTGTSDMNSLSSRAYVVQA